MLTWKEFAEEKDKLVDDQITIQKVFEETEETQVRLLKCLDKNIEEVENQMTEDSKMFENHI